MPSKITMNIKDMLSAANAVITTHEPEAALGLHGRADVVFVDLRDPREIRREGKIPGAFSCPRGMLEFWIDPESPYHKPVFSSGKTFIFFCAGGLRSALATKTAQDMGLEPVRHIEGGFGAWRDAGLPVETGPKNS